MKTRRMLIGTLSAVLLVGGSAYAFVAPVPVIDVGIPENKTWLAQLVQQIATTKNLNQVVQIAIQNTTPTGAGWPNSTGDPRSTEPILDTQVQTLNGYLATVRANTGIQPPEDAGLKIAETAMGQLPSEETDIAEAQAASDGANGDLSAQQAGHRISVLQVTNETKMRQFLYAQQLQRSTDEAAAMTWMSLPSIRSQQSATGAGQI